MKKGINKMTYMLKVKDGKATLKEIKLPKRDNKGRFVGRLKNAYRISHSAHAMFEIVY